MWAWHFSVCLLFFFSFLVFRSTYTASS